jgi:hypothetical protein
MIFNQALNIFPTEIWEMIIYYIFKNDFQTLDFNAKKVCQSIELPFEPMIDRMMNQYLPTLKSIGVEALEKDFTNPDLTNKPLYNSFYLRTKYTLSNLQYRLPLNFYDQLLDKFIENKPKCTWNQARLKMEHIGELYATTFGESSDLDMDSDDEDDDTNDFKLWFTYLYAMVTARIIPEEVFYRVESCVFYRVTSSPFQLICGNLFE